MIGIVDILGALAAFGGIVLLSKLDAYAPRGARLLSRESRGPSPGMVDSISYGYAATQRTP